MVVFIIISRVIDIFDRKIKENLIDYYNINKK